MIEGIAARMKTWK